MLGRWPGWRCTTTRSTRSTRTPSTAWPSRWSRHSPPPCFPSFQAFTTFLVEFPNKFNEKWNISCFFIELARMRSNERASNLTLLFANHAQLSVPPHALTVPLFWLPDSRKLFWICRPRILLQFTLLTVIGSSGPPKVQTFRNSNCLLWLPQHLKEKCGPGISPPIQILRSFQSDLFTFWKWKPSHEESKLHSQRAIGYLMVIWYNNKEKQRAGYYLIS